MADSLAAVVLAAGAGTRLRPLTHLRPKALCPVGGVPLVDLAVSRVAGVVDPGPDTIAVNAHHRADQLAAHLGNRVHLSVEQPVALGTAGAVANLRDWLAGRSALVVNADAWHDADLRPLIAGWDGERVRVIVAGPNRALDPTSRVIGSILPEAEIARLTVEPAGLYEVSWRPRATEGTLDVVGVECRFVDCGRPVDYLTANLTVSGGASVVAPDAVVEGEVVRSVVWPGTVVRRDERLVDAIRASGRVTVLVR